MSPIVFHKFAGKTKNFVLNALIPGLPHFTGQLNFFVLKHEKQQAFCFYLHFWYSTEMTINIV